MGTGGTITMSNLKGATGIADDRLSAHHPDGSGNPTRMGDFLITDIGDLADRDSDADKTTLVAANSGTWKPGDADHSIPADQIKVIVEVAKENGISPKGGSFWPESIGTQNASLEAASLSNLSVADRLLNNTRSDDPLQMYIVCDVTGLDNASIDLYLRDGLNTDATNYNTKLAFSTSDVLSSTKVPAYHTASYDSDNGLTDVTTVSWVPYDPEDTLLENGDGYTEWELSPGKVTGDSGNTTDTFADVDTSDYSCDVTETMQLTLYDQQGGTQHDQITFDLVTCQSDDNAYDNPDY